MAVTTVRRKSPLPPEPRTWKEKPVNAEYEEKAKAFLRENLEKTGNDYASLAEKLNSMGIEITARGLENKISRGSFSAAFLLQCAAALNVSLSTAS